MAYRSTLLMGGDQMPTGDVFRPSEKIMDHTDPCWRDVGVPPSICWHVNQPWSILNGHAMGLTQLQRHLCGMGISWTDKNSPNKQNYKKTL